MSLAKKAFTLVELLIAIMVASILVGATVSLYGLIRASITRDQGRIESAQNARVALDRMSRELRQSPMLVTELPNDTNDLSIAQPGEIEFEDGHANDLTYKRYYLDGTTLRMQVREYFFSTNPTDRVRWNERNDLGQAPVAGLISTQDVAESVTALRFYGDQAVQLEIDTTDALAQTFTVRTAVERRN